MPRYSSRTGQLLEYQAGPFDVAHWYLQWGGKLPGGEEWSCGVRLTPTGGAAPQVTQNNVDTAAQHVSSYHGDARLNLASAAKLSYVKLNNVSTAGLQGQGNTLMNARPDEPGAALGSYIPPNQIALVISLTTGFSRGPAHRGRFYLPLPAYNVGADGTFNEANAVVASEATDEFISDLNGIAAAMEVSVMSRKAGSPGHRRVTGNEVGRVLDTQRRRRRSLLEDYR